MFDMLDLAHSEPVCRVPHGTNWWEASCPGEVQEQLQAEFMYTFMEALRWKISDIGGRTKDTATFRRLLLSYMTITVWVRSTVTLQEHFNLVFNNPAFSKQAALKSAILAQMCKSWASCLLENPSLSCFGN